MKRIENQCVDCGLPCIGDRCSHRNTIVYYCDICGKNASYKIYGEDYCEKCAEEYMQDAFHDLTILEKAKALDIYINEID